MRGVGRGVVGGVGFVCGWGELSVFFFFFLMLGRPRRSPLFPYTTLFGSPVVDARLVGHVAAALGAVAAVVGGVARDRDIGRAVDGRAQDGAVVARLEQVEADRAAGVEVGRAHVCTPVTVKSRLPSSACQK